MLFLKLCVFVSSWQKNILIESLFVLKKSTKNQDLRKSTNCGRISPAFPAR
jgi:hypothetical protein